jgi:ribosomal-protein-alanine N-acetyltransferase
MYWRESFMDQLTCAWKRGLNITSLHGFLRPLVPDDVHSGYVEGLNDPEVNKYLVSVRRQAQTSETVRAFVQENWDASDAVLFGIWVDGHTTHCGTVRLHQINRNDGTGVLGVCIFDKAVWRSSVGSSAIDAVTCWAFDGLGLDAIQAGAYLENVGSWKAFMKVGYTIVEDVYARYQLDGNPTVVRCMIARRPSSSQRPELGNL